MGANLKPGVGGPASAARWLVVPLAGLRFGVPGWGAPVVRAGADVDALGKSLSVRAAGPTHASHSAPAARAGARRDVGHPLDAVAATLAPWLCRRSAE